MVAPPRRREEDEDQNLFCFWRWLREGDKVLENARDVGRATLKIMTAGRRGMDTLAPWIQAFIDLGRLAG